MRTGTQHRGRYPAPARGASAAPGPGAPRRRALVLLALLLAAGLGLAGCNSLFYYPDKRLYYLPSHFGLWSEDVYFKSGDGTQLTGWFLPARGTPRGTIIHFHGNAANISNHLYAVRWLPEAGFSVFLFDYRGYGVSGGTPSRKGLIADGVAAIDYVRSRPDVDPERLVVYGQSLGGAVAISALARAGTKGVRALVVEGAFHSYREVARMVMNETWLLWPFQYPVAYLAFSDDFRPLDDLPRVADVPFLVIHGEADRTVPLAAGKALYDGFPGKDKQMWVIPGAHHMQIFSSDGSPWRARLVRYLDEKLGPMPPPGYHDRRRATRAPSGGAAPKMRHSRAAAVHGQRRADGL